MGSNNAGPQSYTTYIVEEQQMMTDVEAALGVDAHALASSSSTASLVSGQVINLATAPASGSSSSTSMVPAAAGGGEVVTSTQHRVVVVVNSAGTPVGTAVLDNSGRMIALNTDGLAAAGGADGGLSGGLNMAGPACNNTQQQQVQQQQQQQQQILMVVPEDNSSTTVTVTGDNAAMTPGTIMSALNGIVINGEYASEPYDPQGYKATPTDPQGYKTTPTNPQGYKATPTDPQGYKTTPTDLQGYKVTATDPQGYKVQPANLPGYKADPTDPQEYKVVATGSQGYENASPDPRGEFVPKAKRYTRPAAARHNTRVSGEYSLSQRRKSAPAAPSLPSYSPNTTSHYTHPTHPPQHTTQTSQHSTQPPQHTQTTNHPQHALTAEEGASKDPQGEEKGVRSVPHHGMDEFPHQHHLTRSQVEGLFMILGPHYSNPGRRAPLKDFVLASLVLLSSKDSYREMSEQMVFKSRGWMHKTIHLFCKLMVRHLSGIIEWPSGDAVKETAHQFQKIAGVPGVIGAMGTCHMAITKAPVGKSSSFYSNAMEFHSIHLLGVADHRSRFTYVNVGRPGSLHESKVYQGSSLCQIVEKEPHVIFPPNTHIVAGAAFPLHERVLTPYPTLAPPHAEFSTRLQHTRRPLDTAFRLLRSKWKRLECLEMQHVTSMSIAIKTCCILHNICMHNPHYAQQQPQQLQDAQKFVEVEYVGPPPPPAALHKRDLIAHHLHSEAFVT